VRPLDTGGGGKTGTESGSANAAEHRYFPQTSTDRPAKKKPKPKPRPKVRSTPSSSSGYTSPFKAIAPQVVWQGPSAMDMIMTKLPQKEVNYQKEARKIYEPTLDYLDVQDKRVRTRATNNDKSLNNLFSGLASDIEKQSGAINQQYGQAINTVRGATRQGKQDVSKNYDAAAAEQARMMKSLGIEAAAPDVLKGGTEDEAFFQSLIQSAGTGSENFLTSENAGALDYNRAQAGITRQEGLQARTDNKTQLGDILGQLAGKKVDLRQTINEQAQSMQQAAAAQQLEAQKQAAAALQQDRAFAMQNAQFGLQQQQFGLAQQNAQAGFMDTQADNETARARLMLDTSKFQNQTSEQDRAYQLALQKLAQSGTKTAAPVDAWGKGAQLAQSLYGGNQQAASNAIQAVRDAIAANGDAASQWQNPNDLVRAVLKRNPGANDVTQLTSLATYLFQQIFGK
jgi:hypothetical protein